MKSKLVTRTAQFIIQRSSATDLILRNDAEEGTNSELTDSASSPVDIPAFLVVAMLRVT